jgi:quercetin dioxygenase-like cupin family protein
MRTAILLGVLLSLAAVPALAQNAVDVDPKHYKVEFENDQVRIVRVQYGPGEKSVMHEHLPYVAVNLTDGKVRFTGPDGTAEDRDSKAGDTSWTDAETHLPENLSDQPLEAILIEVKP